MAKEGIGIISEKRKQKKGFRKILIISLIAIALIYLIYHGVGIALKVDYILGSGLILYVNPQFHSLHLEYGESSRILFNISSSNPFYCAAECSYSFYDRSRNVLSDSGNFTLPSKKSVEKYYSIKVEKIGEGQNIYNFEVKCRNRKTYFCFSPKNDYRVASSFVSVNYNLSASLSSLKKEVAKTLTVFLTELNNADTLMLSISKNFFDLSKASNLRSLEPQKEQINSMIDAMVLESEKLRALWSAQEYIELSDKLSPQHISNASRLITEIERLNSSISKLIDRHNYEISRVNKISDGIKKSSQASALMFLEEREDLIAKLNSSIGKMNSLKSLLLDNSFKNYDEIGKMILDIEKDTELIENQSINITSVHFAMAELLILKENDFLCALQKNCKAQSTINPLFSEMEAALINGGMNASRVSESCKSFEGIKKIYALIRNITQESINNGTYQIPDSMEFINYAAGRKISIMRNISNLYAESFNNLAGSNEIRNDKNGNSETERILASSLNNSIQKILEEYGGNLVSEIDERFEQNASIYLLSKLNLSEISINFKDRVCSALDKNNVQLKNLSEDVLMPLSMRFDYNISSRVDVNLSENAPVCCVFGKCGQCCSTVSCSNDPSTFPIIFVHGHAVRSSNSPDYSLDTFDKIQYKLQDDGYLNAGILLYSGKDDLNEGDWGLSGKPVTVKTTYYYDIYRKEENYVLIPAKSESIDTYAIRLKDVVDVVKRRTGKPKVNLIAFSMGGLVTRRYIQIYGDNSVNKLITIGSPHKGIVGEVAEVCPLLGENQECRDMQESSLFINKLNDPSKQPKDVKIYTIIGSGCDMGGKDGDGIVLSEHASLRGIVDAKEYYVNGSCKGAFNYLHIELPKIDRHPEVYDYIVESLKE